MSFKQNLSSPNLQLYSSDKDPEKNNQNIFEEARDREGLNNTSNYFFSRRQQFKKMNRKNLMKAKGYNRLNDLSPYFASARHDLIKRSRKSTDEKFSHLFNRYGVNKIFVPPTFTPNMSLEKSINGINSTCVLPGDKSSLIQNVSQGKISICDISGPIVLYLPGNNTKLYLQGNSQNETKEQEGQNQNFNTPVFNSTGNIVNQVDTNSQEKEANQVKPVLERNLTHIGSEPILNKQNSAEKYEQIMHNAKIKEQKDFEIKRKKVKTSGSSKRNKKSDKFLMNKINIALSQSELSRSNIECRIESGSMHEITISSKTNEKGLIKDKATRNDNNELNIINSNKSSRARSKRSQKSKMIFKGKILNKIQDSDDIGSIRAPRKKIIIRNFKGKRIKKIGRLKMFNNHSESYSNLNSPETPIKKLKKDSNMDIQNYYDHYIERQTMTNNQSSPNGKNGVLSISSTANTSVKTK